MNRLTERELFKGYVVYDGCTSQYLPQRAKKAIEKLKYYEDLEEQEEIVKIVKCKDCDIPHSKWTGCPKLNGLITPPDFYCAFGESKNK